MVFYPPISWTSPTTPSCSTLRTPPNFWITQPSHGFLLTELSLCLTYWKPGRIFYVGFPLASSFNGNHQIRQKACVWKFSLIQLNYPPLFNHPQPPFFLFRPSLEFSGCSNDPMVFDPLIPIHPEIPCLDCPHNLMVSYPGALSIELPDHENLVLFFPPNFCSR